MSKAYRVVFECPKGGHNINLQRKCTKPSLSEIEAMEMFENAGHHLHQSSLRLAGKSIEDKITPNPAFQLGFLSRHLTAVRWLVNLCD